VRERSRNGIDEIIGSEGSPFQALSNATSENISRGRGERTLARRAVGKGDDVALLLNATLARSILLRAFAFSS